MTGFYTDIEGVTVSEESETEDYSAYSPFVWYGHAVTMLAFAAAGNEVPIGLRRQAEHIETAADHVVGNVIADTPLGANQFAAAQMAGTIIGNLRSLGHITYEE